MERTPVQPVPAPSASEKKMPLPLKGLPQDEIFKKLEALRGDDLDWRSGRILAYVYDAGPEVEAVINRAYTMFLTESGIDPTTYPSAMRLEREIVRLVADWLRGDAGVVGNFTSGGTESIMCAMKTARDWARANKPEITRPEIVLPRSAHSAFHKAAEYLGLTTVVTDFDPTTFEADVDAIRKAISPNTIALIASAPGFAQGVVDPVPRIAALALERGLLCHVDGCVGGIMLSVMREAGDYKGYDFDFSVPGVTSISADLHKFGYCAKGASVVLYRNRELRYHQIYACARTSTYALVNNTVLSSKSAGPIAAAWAVLHYLGLEGYRAIFREVMDATRRVIAGVNAIPGLRVLGNPSLSMFAIASDELNIFQLADEMKRKGGWYLQPQFSTDRSASNLHVTVNRSTVRVVEPLLADLRECVDILRRSPNKLDPEVVRKQVGALLTGAGPEAMAKASAMAGVKGADLPKDMALINMILDTMPDEQTEAMLVGFMNDMFV